MAINAYCGIMGSGKSYEVVSGPLLDAVAAGRRIVTNVDGISEERIHAYLVATRGVAADELGRIVHVTTERISEPRFFPVENESSSGATVTPGLVEPGDLLVVDEAWKLWAQGEKIPKEHVAFFRMHRHFVHPETGLACDVAMMVQAVTDLHRMLRPVIELSFVMVKLKSLGAPSKYRVEMYEGWKQNRKTRTATYLKSYKKEIFPLYKSYAGAAGKEAVVDKRQNILKNPKLWVIAGALVVCVGVSFVAVWRFFHPKAHGVAGHAAASVAGASAPGVPGVAQPGQGAPVSDVSDEWRIAGRFEVPGASYVVLVDSVGRMRPEPLDSFEGAGATARGRLDGKRVAMWSGAKSAGAAPSPVGVPK